MEGKWGEREIRTRVLKFVNPYFQGLAIFVGPSFLLFVDRHMCMMTARRWRRVLQAELSANGPMVVLQFSYDTLYTSACIHACWSESKIPLEVRQTSG